ncbi:DUF2721 domain-containing protein [Limnovirga soli]|jgi:hypothetical protein|uniref:DUF2721 domain-containing protein n=1 Tax=Limnovirga soli TaxID=2656915 RepID=A0A8J8JTN0_9BACT|nr:DUF2721 domain-containing protein [Limnovirga soli]NNV56118.1 DUF2721 domain-containing protein [Limnovirga soli]
MEISINTPALLFPAISLIMLAYTNRFLALASRVRNLHEKYNRETNNIIIHGQIKSLKYRLKLIKNMQFLGVASFLLAIISMYTIYINQMQWAHLFFALSIISFVLSLIISLLEIIQSTKALELELSDIEGLEDPTIVEYLKKKFDRD